MRNILIILLFSLQANAQGFFPAFTPISYNTSVITGTRTLMNEDFNGSSLSGNWTKVGNQTVTVSGGLATITGVNSNDPKTFGQMLQYSGYGWSCIRNYSLEATFKFTSITASTGGLFIGSHSPTSNNYNFSTFATVAFGNRTSTADTLAVTASPDSIYYSQPIPRTVTGLPTFNTTDWYKIKLIVQEGVATARIIDSTANDSVSIDLNYTFTAANIWPLRPNKFYWSFGVLGRTGISITNFNVKTTEPLYPKYTFVGNSITTGYAATYADSAYGYILKHHTTDSIRIMAGGGLTILDIIDLEPEIIRESGQYIFLNIGTNSGGTTTDYQNLVSAFESAGKTVIPLLIPNGGDPSTSGTWNYFISHTYASSYIDLWTTGWNTMTIGNGLMVDVLHPSLSGHQLLANIIRSAKPILFPL